MDTHRLFVVQKVRGTHIALPHRRPYSIIYGSHLGVYIECCLGCSKWVFLPLLYFSCQALENTFLGASLFFALDDVFRRELIQHSSLIFSPSNSPNHKFLAHFRTLKKYHWKCLTMEMLIYKLPLIVIVAPPKWHSE